VASEAAVDRKVRVPFGHATSPRSIDVSRRKTKTRRLGLVVSPDANAFFTRVPFRRRAFF
jgi:hypothetical protein